MLVLTRKENQALQVGQEVRITVLEIKGGQVRVGIEAPEDVRIVREEIAPPTCLLAPTKVSASWSKGDTCKRATNNRSLGESKHVFRKNEKHNSYRGFGSFLGYE